MYNLVRDAMLLSICYGIVSVCVSDTSPSSIKTAKYTMQPMLHRSLGTYFSDTK